MFLISYRNFLETCTVVGPIFSPSPNCALLNLEITDLHVLIHINRLRSFALFNLNHRPA